MALNQGQSTRARGRGGSRPPGTTHNGAPYPPTHEDFSPMSSMESRGHAHRPRLSQAGLDVPMPGPVPADSTPIRGSPDAPFESSNHWASSCRRHYYSSSDTSTGEGCGPQPRPRKGSQTEKSNSQSTGSDKDRAWAQNAHRFRLVDFIHSQNPDLPRAEPEEAPMGMRPVPLPFRQPLLDPFGGLPVIFPFVVLPWAPYEELLDSDCESRDLSLTESLMKAAMEAQVRHEAIVASTEAPPAEDSSRPHHEKQSPEKDNTEVEVVGKDGGEEAPGGGDWEADYLDALRNPDHPFWTMTPVQIADCPNPRLPGTHFLAVNPAHQPWVSVIELALRNFMSYSKGYRNLEPVPSGSQKALDPAADKNEETCAQFLSNSCLVPYEKPSNENSHPRLAHETEGAQPTATACSPSRPRPGMSMGSPLAPVFRPRQEQPVTNMGPPTAPVFHPRQPQQGASLIPTAPEFHPPQARPGMIMGPPAPVPHPRQPNPETRMSGPGMSEPHQPVPGVPPPQVGPGMHPTFTREGRIVNQPRPLVLSERGFRFLSAPGSTPTPLVPLAAPRPLRPMQGVPGTDPDRLGYLGMTRSEQTGMQTPRQRLMMQRMPFSGPDQLGYLATAGPEQMGIQAPRQRLMQSTPAGGPYQLGYLATKRSEQMEIQTPQQRLVQNTPAGGSNQLGHHATNRSEQMGMQIPRGPRLMRNMPAPVSGQRGYLGTTRPQQMGMQTVPSIPSSPNTSSSNNLQARVVIPPPSFPSAPLQTPFLQALGGPPVPADTQSREIFPSYAPPALNLAPAGKKVNPLVKRSKLRKQAAQARLAPQGMPKMAVQDNRQAPPLFKDEDFPALPGIKEEPEEQK